MEIFSEIKVEECGFGPYPVTLIPNFRLRLKDGVHLAMKVWFPRMNLDDTPFTGMDHHLLYVPNQRPENIPVPVILEYLPYRKADATAPRDQERHPWFCSHGYAVARVDMRGSGDSEGLYFDEYLPQEQQDCCEVIDWLCAQNWCSGNVGMYGKSWGGFNGLQVAFEKPVGLKAVISLYSTDDRYLTDVHYDNGCVIGDAMLSWGSTMLAYNARPPSPIYVKNWKSEWKERLEKSCDPLVRIWLSHQIQDKYWAHGSINQDYHRVTCPVLAIGGWKDGYYDAVFRLVQNLPRCRGIVGPWCHDWPDCAVPGPNVAFLEECLRWWDCHLKGKENGAMETPKLRAYLRDSMVPKQVIKTWPGQWLALDDWPAPEQVKNAVLYPDGATGSLRWQVNDIQETDTADAIFNGNVGINCGPWLRMGDEEQPGDQGDNDNHSLTWTSEPLQENMPLLGFPRFKCRLSCNAAQANLNARICDVTPFGASTLITYGCLNLTHRSGHTKSDIKSLVPGEWYDVELVFHSTGYCVPKGHQVRLSVSPSLWPLVWPPPTNVCLRFRTGRAQTIEPEALSEFILPVCQQMKSLTEKASQFLLRVPTPRITLPMTIEREAAHKKNISSSADGAETTITVTSDDGRRLLKDTGTIIDSRVVETYKIYRDRENSARVDIHEEYLMEWPSENVKADIITESSMWSDQTHFHLYHKLAVRLNGEDFFDREWSDRIERNGV